MAGQAFIVSLLGLDGTPESGGKLYSYSRGTSTPRPLCTNIGLTVPATNPVIADALGTIDCYFDTAMQYTWRAKTANDATTLWEVEVVGGVLSLTYINPDYAFSPLIEASWLPALGAPLGAGWVTALGSAFNAATLAAAHLWAKATWGTLSCNTLAELQALSAPSANVHYKLKGRTAAGQFGPLSFFWDAADQSSTLVVQTRTVSAVDTGTDVLTSAAHNFKTGYGVVASASEAGLTAGALYYVAKINGNTFTLHPTLSDAVAGTNTVSIAALGGALSLKHLADPLQGVYVIPSGSALDGSQGAFKASWSGSAQFAWWGVGAGSTASQNVEGLTAAVAVPAIHAIEAPVGTMSVNNVWRVMRTDIDLYFSRKSRFLVTSQTANFLEIGDGEMEASRISLHGFPRVWASVTKTAGITLYARNWTASRAQIDCGTFNDYAIDTATRRLYEGIRIIGFRDIHLDGEVLCSQNACIIAGTDDYGAEIHVNGWHYPGTDGLCIAGKAGGVYVGRYSSSVAGGHGIRIDKSLAAGVNREVFVSDIASIDICTGWGVYVDDGGLSYLNLQGWVASCGAGGVKVETSTGDVPIVVIDGAALFNNQGFAAEIEDGVLTLTDSRVESNAAGVTLSSSVLESARITGNSIQFNTGSPLVIAANVTGFLVAHNDLRNNGSPVSNAAGLGLTRIIKDNIGLSIEVQANSDPTTAWGLDFTNAPTMTVPDSTNSPLAGNSSGIVVLHDNGDGLAAVFLCYAGLTAKLGGASKYVASSTPSAGEVGLAYDGSDTYDIYNNQGSSRTFHVSTIRTRPSA